jgi:hypothetical protein
MTLMGWERGVKQREVCDDLSHHLELGIPLGDKLLRSPILSGAVHPISNYEAPAGSLRQGDWLDWMDSALLPQAQARVIRGPVQPFGRSQFGVTSHGADAMTKYQNSDVDSILMDIHVNRRIVTVPTGALLH